MQGFCVRDALSRPLGSRSRVPDGYMPPLGQPGSPPRRARGRSTCRRSGVARRSATRAGLTRAVPAAAPCGAGASWCRLHRRARSTAGSAGSARARRSSAAQAPRLDAGQRRHRGDQGRIARTRPGAHRLDGRRRQRTNLFAPRHVLDLPRQLQKRPQLRVVVAEHCNTTARSAINSFCALLILRVIVGSSLWLEAPGTALARWTPYPFR